MAHQGRISDVRLTVIRDVEIEPGVVLPEGLYFGKSKDAELSAPKGAAPIPSRVSIEFRGAHLTGMGATLMLRGPGILVARELGAAETAELDLSMVTGIAVATGSPTSHSAILARALGVPAVVNAGDGLLTIPEETILLIDGKNFTF